MVKVISSTSREDLLLGICDILEINHQESSSGYCPWCSAEEELDEVGPEEYHINHYPTCPVTMLERLLHGTYKRHYLKGEI